MSMIPTALFNSKALFNPYQYKPFLACMKNDNETWKWKGYNLFITDEVGVGKTFEAGIILQELLKNNPNLTVLIVCPARLCANWEREMQENFYIAPVNYRVAKSFGQLTILPYSYFRFQTEKQEESLEEAKKTEAELQSASFDGKSCEITYPEYDVLILDEAHYIRNDGALHQHVKHMIEQNEPKENQSDKLDSNKFKVFLTATPIFNSEQDYVNITSLLNYNDQTFATTATLQGEANCYDFQLNIKMQPVKLNCEEKNIIADIYETEDGISKYGRLTGFLKRISASSFFSLKEFVTTSGAWEEEYECEEYEGDGDNKLNLPDLKELCDSWTESADSKFDALQELLNNLYMNVNKVVIFSCFLHTCDYLERRLKQVFTVYKITGKTPAKAMEQIVTNFRNTIDKAILICSDAVKEGQNFQFCQHLIHYDFPFTPAAMGQRNGRIYRKGQKGQPNVYYMFGKSTYDERLFGEIIITKTKIVKNASEQRCISTLNVLPQDPGDYFQNSIAAYFNDLVEQLKRNLKQKDGQDTGAGSYTPEQAVLRAILLKQFSYMEGQDKNRKRVWDITEAEKAYGEDLPDSENCCSKLIEILSKCLPEDKGKSLALIYREKYKKELINFNENIFGCHDDNFESHCRSYLKYCGIDSEEHKFCHDMLADAKITLTEYQKQFKPLIELKRGEGNRD